MSLLYNAVELCSLLQWALVLSIKERSLASLDHDQGSLGGLWVGPWGQLSFESKTCPALQVCQLEGLLVCSRCVSIVEALGCMTVQAPGHCHLENLSGLGFSP